MSEKTKMIKCPVDGIDFYVSQDTQKKGMSVQGLSLFSGMPRTTVRRRLEALKNGRWLAVKEISTDHACFSDYSAVPESLQPFAGKDGGIYIEDVTTDSNAKIVSAAFCEAFSETLRMFQK